MDHAVELAHDHPGFADRAYRARRDAIARLASIGNGAPFDVDYADEEHALWASLARDLAPLHARYACSPILAAAPLAALDRDRVPQLADVSARLRRSTGFRLRAVAGLVPSREFFGALARGVFLSTQYLRHASRPHYTPEPDVAHELFGHAASLADPRIADLNRAIGRASIGADDATIADLERIYWFTFEFGLVLERGERRALGAGLLSSIAELRASCAGEGEAPALEPFSIEAVLRTPFDTSKPQPVLFVASSFDDMAEELSTWIESNAFARNSESAA